MASPRTTHSWPMRCSPSKKQSAMSGSSRRRSMRRSQTSSNRDGHPRRLSIMGGVRNQSRRAARGLNRPQRPDAGSPHLAAVRLKCTCPAHLSARECFRAGRSLRLRSLTTATATKSAPAKSGCGCHTGPRSLSTPRPLSLNPPSSRRGRSPSERSTQGSCRRWDRSATASTVSMMVFAVRLVFDPCL